MMMNWEQTTMAALCEIIALPLGPHKQRVLTEDKISIRAELTFAAFSAGLAANDTSEAKN